MFCSPVTADRGPSPQSHSTPPKTSVQSAHERDIWAQASNVISGRLLATMKKPLHLPKLEMIVQPGLCLRHSMRFGSGVLLSGSRTCTMVCVCVCWSHEFFSKATLRLAHGRFGHLLFSVVSVHQKQMVLHQKQLQQLHRWLCMAPCTPMAATFTWRVRRDGARDARRWRWGVAMALVLGVRWAFVGPTTCEREGVVRRSKAR